MEAIARQDSKPCASIRQIALASSIGTAIEYYDFLLYGTAAALVFPKLFFPGISSLAATLASFATFGVAYLARPIGGLIFGHFGDRFGRKAMLVITLLLMGGSTFLIGLLPSVEQVGLLAPLLLAVLRFTQGFALGGEWSGATLMAVEHAPEEHRNFYASWPQFGAPVGWMLSTIVFTAFSSLPNGQFFVWGWRAPFLLSLVLIAVGMFIRLRIPESPAFTRIKRRGQESRLPVVEIFRKHRAEVVIAVGVALVNTAGFNIVITFTLSYVTGQLGLPRSVPLTGYLLSGIADILAILIFSAAADRVGKRRAAIWAAAGALFLSCPFFWLVDTAKPILICSIMGAWMFAAGGLWALTGVLIADLFPARVRYSGTALGYNVAGIIGGAPAPLIATALIRWTGGASWPVAGYLVLNALASLIALCMISEKYSVAGYDPGPLLPGVPSTLE